MKKQLTVEKALQLSKEANLLKTDNELLQFAKDNKGYIVVVLDNDATWLNFNLNSVGSDEEAEKITEFELPDFDDDFGNRSGVNVLLDFVGIDSEDC